MKTRTEILSGSIIAKPQTIEIPEWGGTFQLMPLDGLQSEQIAFLTLQAQQTGDFSVLHGLAGKVATWTIADAEGNRVFKPSDAETLTRNYFDIVTRVLRLARQVNSLEDEGDAEKN